MMEAIDVFINCKDDFRKNLQCNDEVYEKFNPIFVDDARVFKKLYDNFLKNIPFRLWVHLDLNDAIKTSSGYSIVNSIIKQKRYSYLKVQYITRKSTTSEFEGIKIYYLYDDDTANWSWAEFDFSPIINHPISKKDEQVESSTDNSKNKNNIDIAIITALYYNEMEKIKDVFELSNNKHKISIGNYSGYMFSCGDKNIVAVSQAEMGMVDAAILTSEIINRFKPKYVIMPGVCGGSSKTSVGDIVISTKVESFFNGKLTDYGFENDNFQEQFDTELLENIKPEIKFVEQDERKGIIQDIENILRQSQKYTIQYHKFYNKELNFHVEPTACSPFVINKKGFFEDYIKSIDRKMIAVEMEGYGMARAVKLSKTDSKAILIKCVMDKTEDKDKDINGTTPDENKDYAALVSALFVKRLIEQNLLK